MFCVFGFIPLGFYTSYLMNNEKHFEKQCLSDEIEKQTYFCHLLSLITESFSKNGTTVGEAFVQKVRLAYNCSLGIQAWLRRSVPSYCYFIT